MYLRLALFLAIPHILLGMNIFAVLLTHIGNLLALGFPGLYLRTLVSYLFD